MNNQTATILPNDEETQQWFSGNIENGNVPCSASSAIYKFRLWLKDRQQSISAPPVEQKSTTQQLFVCQKCGEEFSSGEAQHGNIHAYCGGQGDPNGFVEEDDASEPVTEQTSEAKTFLDEHTFDWSELKTRFDRHAQNWTTYSAAQEYADLRCKEMLEAAAKELPTKREITDEAHRRKGFIHERIEGALWLREQAAPIIAALKWQLEVQKGLNTSIIEAYEKLGHDALRKENDTLHSRVRELEADGWIPIKDRLPESEDVYGYGYENSDSVLIYTNGSYAIGSLQLYTQDNATWGVKQGDWVFKGTGFVDKKPTHWKPLTPPTQK